MKQAHADRKILIVNQSAQFGGAEVYLIDIVDILLQAGCQITILLCNDDIPDALRKGLASRNVQTIKQNFGVWKPDAILYNRRFAKLLDQVAPDIVFFNRTGGWGKFSDLIPTARLKRISRLVSVEHYHPPPFPIRLKQPVRTVRNLAYCRFQGRCLDAIICMSAAARDIFTNKKYAYSQDKLHVIYNGIDTDKFRFDAALREVSRKLLDVSERTVVLFCGRLSEEKGPQVLIEAWGLLSEAEREKLFLLVIGDGGMKKQLEDKIEHLNLCDSVSIKGFQENPLDYLCACDIFVLPSLEESFGISLAEAMATGRYAIATKVGGIPELLPDATKGTLINPNAPEQLAETIRKAAENPEYRRVTGAAAEQHVRACFAVEKTKAETLRVILGEANTRTP